jgi:hypothetical protein
MAAFPPVCKAPVSELDMAGSRSLPLLVDDLKRKENLASSALFSEQEAVNHPLSVDFDLPDVTLQLVHVGMTASFLSDFGHCHSDSSRVFLGKAVEEFAYRLAASRGAKEPPTTPKSPSGWLGGSRSGQPSALHHSRLPPGARN